MKKKYEIQMTEILSKTVTVEADSDDEAIHTAMDKYDNSEEGYILTADDHDETEFLCLTEETND